MNPIFNAAYHGPIHFMDIITPFLHHQCQPLHFICEVQPSGYAGVMLMVLFLTGSSSRYT